MVNMEYSSVPTTVELENNSNQKKYTVNRSPKGNLVISKPVCALMAIGAILLALLAALGVFLLLPRCNEASPAPLINSKNTIDDEIDERLPRSISPKHYRIYLKPDLYADNPYAEGNVTITLDVKAQTNKIIFNIKDININKHSITVSDNGKNINVTETTNNEEAQKYTIALQENLKVGNEYSLFMNFTYKLNDQMQGFYTSRYTDRNSSKIMASTQFSPTDARRAFPCFDEPSFKAIFEIHIAKPSNMNTLSNMPKQEVTFVDNVIWDHYRETPIMPTYLVAFVVSDLQQFRYNISEKLFTVWSRRDVIDEAGFATEFAPKTLQFYEKYFGIDFPLPKIDVVAIPDFGFNAMENWGLITFRERTLLWNKKSSTIDHKKHIASVTAHELVHQWFGNLVTPKWWNDLWLKEGFANYFRYLAMDNIFPSWNIMQEFTSLETYEAFALDCLKSARPISSHVQNNQQIRQAFDSLSYSKGAAVIRMLNNSIGEEAFKNGIKEYLNIYQYSNADQDDLWKTLTAHAHKQMVLNSNTTIKDIMDTWTLQAGFPVVTAIMDYTNRKLTFSQRRFFISNQEQDDSTWWIPISITRYTNQNFEDTKPKLWLEKEREKTIHFNTTGWYLLNLKQTGYYIVNYDERNWKALTDHVMELPVVIRAQLISDSMDLARANLLDYDIPLRIIANVGTKDLDVMYLSISTAFDKLEFLSDVLATTSLYRKFNNFLSIVFNYAYNYIDFNDLPPDDYIKLRIQSTVLKWACKIPDSRCVVQARQIYRSWMAHGLEITPNIREVIYCTAIREGEAVEWDFAYKQFLNAKQPTEKDILLDALGCASKHYLLSKYLEMMISNSSGIRKQDGAKVFDAVAKNIVGYRLAFDFLRNNWIAINEHFGEGFNTVGKMVGAISTYMNTAYQLKELEDFKSEVTQNLGTTEQAFNRSIEKAKANVAWIEHSYKSIEEWLNEYNRHFGL